MKNLKSLKYHICSKCGSEDEKVFKEGESVVILKILGLIEK